MNKCGKSSVNHAEVYSNIPLPNELNTFDSLREHSNPFAVDFGTMEFQQVKRAFYHLQLLRLCINKHIVRNTWPYPNLIHIGTDGAPFIRKFFSDFL